MFLVATSLPCFPGEDAPKGRFDLPAGEAETSLKLLSEQSGVEILFPTDLVAGIRTNAVQGEMTARQALDAMIVGTGLVAVEGKNTVSLTVKRRTPGEDAREKTRSADQSSAGKPSRELPEEDETEITKQPLKRNKILTKLGALLILIIAPMDAQTAATANAGAEATSDEVVKMSPFDVRAQNVGYYAPNTLSGTRLNSKVEDLAASLTVVTKEQMTDFAMLDINDVFLYEAGVEGTGTYTDAGFDRNGTPLDNTQLDPYNANRIRGIGKANIAFNNYQVSGRIPIDPTITDSLEISRGPNASIFGLGGAAGTVNTVSATANLQRASTVASLRADDEGGWRASLDVNRVIKQDVLAVRASAVRERKGFDLKPSGINDTKFNGFVTYKPFKNTKVSAAYHYYHSEGCQPNASMPRDFVSLWLATGKPTWNAKTGMVSFSDGRPSVAANVSTIPTMSGGALTQWSGANTVYVNPDGTVGYWSVSRGTTSTTDPVGATLQTTSFLATLDTRPLRVGLTGASGTPLAGQVLFETQPLFSSEPVVSSKDVYDWSSINLGANNFLDETGRMANLELEQTLVNTRRQQLVVQAGFFRETGTRYRREFIGNNSDSFSGKLYVDANEVLMDGTPNPYLGRTFLGARFPTSYNSPLDRDTYRVQAAYRLDLRQEKNLLRWLGLHQLLGYGEYKDFKEGKLFYRDAILSDHSWLAHGAARAPTSNLGGLPKGPNSTLNWFNYYVGDNQGYDIDYAPRDFTPGTYSYHWGNGVTSAFFTEPAILGLAENGSRNTNPIANVDSTRDVIKTQGGILQSHFLDDRIITTFGLRRDWKYSRFGAFLPYIGALAGDPRPVDGVHVDPVAFKSYAADWAQVSTGMTKQAGVVVRPLPGRWANLLSLHYNKSDSFKPAEIKWDLHLNFLPDPTGESNDYGFTLNLLDSKLVARYIKYDTKELNSRSSVPQIPGRTRPLDFETSGFINSTNDPYDLVHRATRWVTEGWVWNATTKTWTPGAPNPALTADQIKEQVSIITGLDLAHIESTAKSSGEFANAGDVQAKGEEIEINYNPSRFWTIKLNLDKMESIDLHLSQDVVDWIDERMPYWTSIIDPEFGEKFWDHVGYQSDLGLPAVGANSPHTHAPRVLVSASAIGYYGLKEDPTRPTVYTRLDVNQPIWDKSHFYVDAFVNYRTRLFADKVHASFQLNVRNLGENGRLQPTAAFPNGVPSSLRIVSPQQFILSATFDL